MYTGFDKLSFFKNALTHTDHEVSLQAAKALAQLQPVGFPERYAEEFKEIPEVVERLLHAADRRLQGV
jgi:hypothetical protein